MSDNSSFQINGVHHIELTVSVLERSKEFYSKLPGFKVVASYDNFVMFYNGKFYLGLTDHKGKLGQSKFDETNVGLDHVSFQVSTKVDIQKALDFLEKENIPHGEIKKLSNDTVVLAFRDPDNIQLEFACRV